MIKNRFVFKSLALAYVQLRLYCNRVCWWPLATTTATVTILPTQHHHIPLLLGCENIWKHFSFPQALKWRAPQSSLSHTCPCMKVNDSTLSQQSSGADLCYCGLWGHIEEVRESNSSEPGVYNYCAPQFISTEPIEYPPGRSGGWGNHLLTGWCSDLGGRRCELWVQARVSVKERLRLKVCALDNLYLHAHYPS